MNEERTWTSLLLVQRKSRAELIQRENLSVAQLFSNLLLTLSIFWCSHWLLVSGCFKWSWSPSLPTGKMPVEPLMISKWEFLIPLHISTPSVTSLSLYRFWSLLPLICTPGTGGRGRHFLAGALNHTPRSTVSEAASIVTQLHIQVTVTLLCP